MQYVYYPDGTQHMYSTQMIDDVTRLSHTADNNIGLNIQYWPWQVNSLQSVTSSDMLDEYQNLLCWYAYPCCNDTCFIPTIIYYGEDY